MFSQSERCCLWRRCTCPLFRVRLQVPWWNVRSGICRRNSIRAPIGRLPRGEFKCRPVSRVERSRNLCLDIGNGFSPLADGDWVCFNPTSREPWRAQIILTNLNWTLFILNQLFGSFHTHFQATFCFFYIFYYIINEIVNYFLPISIAFYIFKILIFLVSFVFLRLHRNLLPGVVFHLCEIHNRIAWKV